MQTIYAYKKNIKVMLSIWNAVAVNLEGEAQLRAAFFYKVSLLDLMSTLGAMACPEETKRSFGNSLVSQMRLG